MALLLLLLHVVGLVSYQVLIRRSLVEGANKYQLAALLQSGIFGIALVAWALGILEVSFDHSSVQWLSLLASGGFIAGLHVLTVQALNHIEASQFSIIFNMRLVLTTILAYLFLGDIPEALQMLGGFLIFTAVITLGIRKAGWHWQRSFWWGILAVSWFSVHALVEKYNIDQVGFETYMIVVGLTATALLWGLAWYKSDSIAELKTLLTRRMLAPAIARAVSAWTYVAAIGSIQLATANYISGMSVIGTVAVGYAFLGERDQPRQKVLATIMAAIGLTLIFIGRE